MTHHHEPALDYDPGALRQRSGGRCEMWVYTCPAYLEMGWSERCPRPATVVDQRSAEREGPPRLSDLVHLCRFHHLVAQALQVRCRRCGQAILAEQYEDAAPLVAEVSGYTGYTGDSEALAALTAAIRARYEGACAACWSLGTEEGAGAATAQ